MITEHEIDHVIGSTLYSQDDEKIGRVGQVFLDDNTGQPEFLTVNTGLFGTSESFVPAQEASYSSDRVVVPFGKDQVKDAPNVDVDGGHLDESQERQLFDYYGLDYGTAGTGQDRNGSVDRVSGDGNDTSGANTDDAMTRSEERLDVGTTEQEAGRARLRKYVTTEQQTVTVPVKKERAVLETEPDHRRQRRARHGRARHLRGGARGGPQRGASRGLQDHRAGRARAVGHRDGDRTRDGDRGRPQGAHRGRGRRRRPSMSPASPSTTPGPGHPPRSRGPTSRVVVTRSGAPPWKS